MTSYKIAQAALAASVCLTLLFAASARLPAQTQAQMNQMAFRDEANADAALNVVYKKLLAKLESPDQAKLKKAERAWLLFRDADADSLASQQTGGSVYPLVRAEIAQGITEARTKELAVALQTLQHLQGSSGR